MFVEFVYVHRRKKRISNKLMYNEVLWTKWKDPVERVKFECTLEGNTEQNPEQLLLAYISESDLLHRNNADS